MNILGKILIAIMLFYVILLLAGCVVNYESTSENNGQDGFDQNRLAVLNIYQEDSLSTDKLLAEIEYYKSFSEEFFSIWSSHIDKTSGVLESFNRDDISIDKKIEYALILERDYQDFQEDLKAVNPPDIAADAYEVALKTISYRILFFKSFSEGAGIEELEQLENQAYLLETLFWEEIDKLYEYFDTRIKEHGQDNDFRFVINKL
jgi:hypothetical protein